MIDYEGYNSLLVFTTGCNYSCPTCYNKFPPSRFTEKEIFKRLEQENGWFDGIAICGGEPTIQKDLILFLEKLRKFEIDYKGDKLKIKLDTNGSNPQVIEEVVSNKLVDYIALDIKGPFKHYNQLCGTRVNISNLEETIKIIQNVEHEYRTTFVPLLEDKFRWFYDSEVEEMAVNVKNIAENGKWYMQQFRAVNKETMIDERFAIDNIPREFEETPRKKLEEYAEIIKKYGFDAKVR